MSVFAGPLSPALSAICSLISGILSIFGAFKKKETPSLTDQITHIIEQAFRDFREDLIVDAKNTATFDLNLHTQKIDAIQSSIAAKGAGSPTDLNTAANVTYLSSTAFAQIGKELFGQVKTQIEKVQEKAKGATHFDDPDGFSDECKKYAKYLSSYCQVAIIRNSLLYRVANIALAYNLTDTYTGITQQIAFLKTNDLSLLTPWDSENNEVKSRNIFLHPAMWLPQNELKAISSYLVNIGIKAPKSNVDPNVYNPFVHTPNECMTVPRVYIKSIETQRLISWGQSNVYSTEETNKFQSECQFSLHRLDNGKFKIKKLIPKPHDAYTELNVLSIGSEYTDPNKFNFWAVSRHPQNYAGHLYTFYEFWKSTEWKLELKDNGKYFFIFGTEIGGYTYYLRCMGDGTIYVSDYNSYDHEERFDVVLSL